jgi:predicted thioesterase
VEIDGRCLIFEVEARNGAEVIGRGRVFHTIVEQSRFAANVTAKPSSR